MPPAFSNILSEFRKSRFAILEDDGVSPSVFALVCPAADITTEEVNTFVNSARAVICVALSEDRIRELGLPPMDRGKRDENSALEFSVSVEARQNVSTGISSADRAETLRTVCRTREPRLDLVMPGHIFPLRARQGGVLVRNTLVEGAYDLVNLAGFEVGATLCHCLDDKGELLTAEGADQLARTHSWPLLRISDITRHRLATETIIEKISEARLPMNGLGEFQAIVFRAHTDNAEHLALVRGQISESGKSDPHPVPHPVSHPVSRPVLARVQSEHRVGDLIGQIRQASCVDSRATLRGALKAIDQENRGIFVYVRHPQQGFLAQEVAALQGPDVSGSSGAHLREVGIGAQILRALGARKIRLLTNSKRDITGLDAFGLELVERVSFEPYAD